MHSVAVPPKLWSKKFNLLIFLQKQYDAPAADSQLPRHFAPGARQAHGAVVRASERESASRAPREREPRPARAALSDCDLRLVCGIATTVHIHATGSGSDEAQVILPPRAS
jgi:hypothetical protein